MTAANRVTASHRHHSVRRPALPTADELHQAQMRIASLVHTTPVVRADWLGRSGSFEVDLKLENVQRTGSYKVRGAAAMISRLPEVERSKGVVAASAGNHAQGVALSASLIGIDCTIFMPLSASWPKVVATQKLGATVKLIGASFDEALAAARSFIAETGATFVPPFDHPDVVAGQASVGLELVRQLPDLDAIVVPVGGGGLIAGVAAAMEHHRVRTGHAVRVIGAQAAGAASFVESLAAGRPTRLDSVDTMADGIAVAAPGALPFEIVSELGVEVVTVGEPWIARAVTQIAAEAKQVAEPAAAVGVAALMEGVIDLADVDRVALVISGGNIDPLLMQTLLTHDLVESDRYLTLDVILRDRPGALSRLIDIVASQNTNLVDISHERTPPELPLNYASVRLRVETRGRDQQVSLAAALETAGYDVSLHTRR